MASEKEAIRILVKTKDDIQKMRIQMANRVKLDKDMNPQHMENQADTIRNEDMDATLKRLTDRFIENEKDIDSKIKEYVKNEPIYKKFLSTVKGVGPQMAAVIISEIDIVKATTVSKIWQYAGMNPGNVAGKKFIDGKIVLSDEQIRGDKPTKGFILPYNAFLKSKMLGVLASSFIKSKSPYTSYYYDCKTRLENSEKVTTNGKMWSEQSLLHRDNAAKRYMLKMFLKDLYVAWRTLEGLEVRPSYQEEYLGHTHVSSYIV